MSPHRHETLLLIGMVGTSWWGQLSPIKKALAAMATVAVIAFAAGSMVAQLMVERTGGLARLQEVEQRLDRTERLAVRDSARLDDVEARREQVDALAARVARIESTLDNVDDRTQRIVCLLSGNRGASCL